MKIIIVGDTSSTNFGDPLLTYCTEYLYKKAFQEISQSVDTVIFDIAGRKKKKLSERLHTSSRSTAGTSKDNLRNLKSLVKDLQYLRKWAKVESEKFEDRLKNEIGQNVDYIIFAGGAMFSAAIFYAVRLNGIINYAEKNNIKVIFNSVGVERSLNWFTRRIAKTVLNSSSVVSFSTRDHVDEVARLTNRREFHRLTPDSGLFASECYGISAKRSGIVGIGVISYEAYLSVSKNDKRVYNLKEEDLINFWVGIIRNLEHKEIKWKIFTNGGKADYQEALKLIERLGVDKERFLAPLPESPVDLVDTISAFDIVMAHRLHALIIASSLLIPVIPMVWSDKVVFFSKMIGAQSFWPQNENIESIVQLIERKEDANDSIIEHLKSLAIENVIDNIKL